MGHKKGRYFITVTGQRRARQIRELADEGKSCREISKIVGINFQRVSQIAKRYCIPLNTTRSRRVTAYHSIRRAEILVELAKEANVSPAVMVDNAVRLLVDEGIEAARKKLGKMALPKQTYAKRRPAAEAQP